MSESRIGPNVCTSHLEAFDQFVHMSALRPLVEFSFIKYVLIFPPKLRRIYFTNDTCSININCHAWVFWTCNRLRTTQINTICQLVFYALLPTVRYRLYINYSIAKPFWFRSCFMHVNNTKYTCRRYRLWYHNESWFQLATEL